MASPDIPNPPRIQKLSHGLSHAAVQIFPCRIDELKGEQARSFATGFLWLLDDIVYLITNWHVVTGRDPETQAPLGKLAPTHVRVLITVEGEQRDGLVTRDHKDHAFPLFDQDGRALWFEHPTHGHNVDVIMLELAKLGGAKLLSKPINSHDDFVDFEVAVIDDVFILGFPRGISAAHNLPIWKRGSIATEPSIDIGGLPKMYVDTATREGMSGSPAVAARRGWTVPRGKSTNEGIFGTCEAFLGIYSGRIGDDALGAQLGIVWKKEVITEIISSKVRSSYTAD